MAAPTTRDTCVGEWRSLVAHLVWDQRAGGSNPLSPTISFKTGRITIPTHRATNDAAREELRGGGLAAQIDNLPEREALVLYQNCVRELNAMDIVLR